MDPEQQMSLPPEGEPLVSQPPDAPPPPPAESHLQGLVPVVLAATLMSVLVARISRSRAARGLRRWLPLLYTSIWATAVVFITWMYARGLSSTWFLAIWLVFLLIALASVGWLRSVMSGVALSIEGRIRIGDSIRVGAIEGEVIAFGMRAMRVRAVDGTVHEIPNEKLVTEAVANLSGEGGDSACELTLTVPSSIDPDDALDIARSIAVLTPLASPRHRPEVFLIPRQDEDQRYDLRVRGYAFDAMYSEHYRSDVTSRMQAVFAKRTQRRETTHDSRILTAEE